MEHLQYVCVISNADAERIFDTTAGGTEFFAFPDTMHFVVKSLMHGCSRYAVFALHSVRHMQVGDGSVVA